MTKVVTRNNFCVWSVEKKATSSFNVVLMNKNMILADNIFHRVQEADLTDITITITVGSDDSYFESFTILNVHTVNVSN